MTTTAPEPMAVIILAAGKGTRMRSELPKVMHKIAGESMISHVLHTASSLTPEQIVVVLGSGMDQVAAESASKGKVICVVQPEQLGTADAVGHARTVLKDFKGRIAIIYGDTPLITPAIIDSALRELDSNSVVAIGMRPHNPAGYGRLVVDKKSGELIEIIEHKDASESQREINLCNSGIMAVRSDCLWKLLDLVGNNNASGEFYLTDLVRLARKSGLACGVVEGSADALSGVNSRAELAKAEAIFQNRQRQRVMEEGATLVAPETVFLSRDTRLGRDVTIHPNVIFGRGVVVEDGAEIKSFSHLEECVVGKSAIIGPFARLRPGAVLERGAHIGNFVEVKNSTIGTGAKINHLSYVGDSTVGRAANIGAGTITCNYDGFTKSSTTIGDYAFIGSNTALVAPVHIGEGAIVGAGSVIVEDVPADAMALSRPMQMNMPEKARTFRNNRGSQKRRLS